MKRYSVFFWAGGIIVYWLVLFFFAPLDVRKVEKYFKEKRDWKEITEEDTLRVLFLHHPADVFVYKGAPMGFCYDLVKNFASEHNLFIKTKFIDSDIEGLRKLSFEQWDLMAVPYPALFPSFPGTTYTGELYRDEFILYCPRLNDKKNNKQYPACCIIPYQWYNFSHLPFFTEFCICKTSLRWRYLQQSLICNDSIPDLIFFGPQKWLSFLVGFQKKNIKPFVQIPFCWVVRNDAKVFSNELNVWLFNQKKSGLIVLLLAKYYDYNFSHKQDRSSMFHSFFSSKLSNHDDLIRKHAKTIGMDWLLLASLIYEESKFQENLISPSGAYGIMQLMPFIMSRYGIDSSSSVDKQIYAGIKLLKEFNDVFEKFALPPSIQIRILILAYNTGFFPIKQCIEFLQAQQSLQKISFAQILDCLENNKKFKFSKSMTRQGKIFVKNIFERYLIYRELYHEERDLK